MARKNGESQYRKLLKTFWTDERIQQLAREEKSTEIAVILHALQGIYACRNKNISGIYVIHREAWQTFAGLNLEKTTNALNYINAEMSSILVYDFSAHTIFIKKFFHYQTEYKAGLSVIPDLMEGFSETFEKAPQFWAEFGQKYRHQLNKLLLQLSKQIESQDQKNRDLFLADQEEQLSFLTRLCALKDEINNPDFPYQPKPVFFKTKDHDLTYPTQQ